MERLFKSTFGAMNGWRQNPLKRTRLVIVENCSGDERCPDFQGDFIAAKGNLVKRVQGF